MKSKFKIQNSAEGILTIDIEGVIGIDETKQFSAPATKVATYHKFKSQLDLIDKENINCVVVNIRSAGGDVNDALLIHDALKELKCTVATYCYGYVASAATIIAQAASKDKRYISENALYLIHNSTSPCNGNKESLNQTVKLLEATDNNIAELYANRADKNVEIFKDMMAENSGNGSWRNPSEVIDANLADQIIEASPINNRAKQIVEMFGLPNLPIESTSLIDRIKQKISNKYVNTKNTTEEPKIEIIEIQNISPNDSNESNSQTKILHKGWCSELPDLEDPSIDNNKLKGNQNAYWEDAQQFK